MKILLITYCFFSLISPAEAVTTKMFKVLDTCARYRIKEINADQTLDKLKLNVKNNSINESQKIVSKYCAVFTPNHKIEY